MNPIYQKETQVKLTKNLLDPIILRYLEKESVHGYQLITKIRKDYGIYFGPSTIYPLLNTLEKKGYLKSTWNMNEGRPRKEYALTAEGKYVLKFADDSLNMICRSLLEKAGQKPEKPSAGMIVQQSSQRTIICQ